MVEGLVTLKHLQAKRRNNLWQQDPNFTKYQPIQNLFLQWTTIIQLFGDGNITLTGTFNF